MIANQRELSNPESIEWSIRIKKRDKYICKCCGSNTSKLVSHHVNPWHLFPNDRADLNNGICLCNSCHNLYHEITILDECNYGTLTNFIIDFNKGKLGTKLIPIKLPEEWWTSTLV